MRGKRWRGWNRQHFGCRRGIESVMSDPFDLADIPEPSVPMAAPYLEALNPPQRDAAETTEGPVLILAGAGTGKTRALTSRLAHILHSRLAFPSQILAVTFTNKAAREMRERVAAMVGRAVEGIWLGTFHSIGVRILRRHAELVGLKSNFTILDTDDQLRLLKQVLEAENIDVKRWPPRNLAACIDRWKDKGLTPDKLTASDAEAFANGRGKELYQLYQDRLKALNATDFGDLLLHVLTILTKEAEVLKHYQEQFKYVLVDEYQDTNVVQYLLLRLLAQKHKNICCVGDDDQSIYSWRGAEVGNILRFEKDFPGAKIVRLEQNYRSTPQILAAAAGLIAKNEERHGKTLWTQLNEGEQVKIKGVWDGEEEARVVGDDIEQLQRQDHDLNDMAILVRAGFQTREFEERMITIGVPYRLIGGTKFYERAHIRDAMAYCRVIAQPADDLAFERIVNKPKRALGAKSVQMIHQLARSQNMPMTKAAQLLCETEELSKRARTSLAELMGSFDRWRNMLEHIPHTEIVEMVLDESGYTQALQIDKSPAAPGRLEDLKELIYAMEPFENLQGFLEHVSLVMDTDNAVVDDAVNVMTLHGAKGLEFDTVFLPGWEEGLFPHQRSLDEAGNAGLEEERRLAYVGLTRAKQRAIISYAANRRMFDRWVSALPSRFIADLPGDHVEQEVNPGISTGANYFDTAPGAFNYSGKALPSGGSWRSGPGYLEGQADIVVSNDPDVSSRAIGERVFHIKFGYGRIVDIDGNKLEIDFEKAGIKKVIDSFVETVS